MPLLLFGISHIPLNSLIHIAHESEFKNRCFPHTSYLWIFTGFDRNQKSLTQHKFSWDCASEGLLPFLVFVLSARCWWVVLYHLPSLQMVRQLFGGKMYQAMAFQEVHLWLMLDTQLEIPCKRFCHSDSAYIIVIQQPKCRRLCCHSRSWIIILTISELDDTGAWGLRRKHGLALRSCLSHRMPSTILDRWFFLPSKFVLICACLPPKWKQLITGHLRNLKLEWAWGWEYCQSQCNC